MMHAEAWLNGSWSWRAGTPAQSLHKRRSEDVTDDDMPFSTKSDEGGKRGEGACGGLGWCGRHEEI